MNPCLVFNFHNCLLHPLIVAPLLCSFYRFILFVIWCKTLEFLLHILCQGNHFCGIESLVCAYIEGWNLWTCVLSIFFLFGPNYIRICVVPI